MDKTYHIKVDITCKGDEITAMGEAIQVAKTVGDGVYLSFPKQNNLSLYIHPTSEVQDIITIFRLKTKQDK